MLTSVQPGSTLRVMLVVADALRHDLFWRRFRRKDGKVGNVFPAGMGTPVATLALLYGITPSYLYWPKEVKGEKNFLKIFDAHIINSSVRKLHSISLPKVLEREKVKTIGIIFNDLVVQTPFIQNIRPCVNTMMARIKRWLNRLVPNLLKDLELMDVLINQNPFVNLWGEVRSGKRGCTNLVHARKARGLIFRILEEAMRYENVFVYLHLLTPHEPYLCREFYQVLETVKDLLRNARYVPLRKRYVELQRGSHETSKEESIRRIRKFYEKFEELEKILEVNKVVLDAKEAYKACVEEVIEFLDELRERFGKEWKIIFTSDHPEYFGEGGTLQHEFPFPFGKTLRSPIYIHGEYGELGEIYQTRIPEIVSHFFGVEFKSKAREKVMEDLRYLGAPLLSFYTEEGGPYVRIHSHEGLEFEMGSEEGKKVVMKRIRRAMVFRGLLKVK